MKKLILAVLVIMAIIISGCSGDDNLSHAFGSAISELEDQNDGESRSENSEAMPGETNTNDSMFENPSGIDYSVYSTILRGYQKYLLPMRSLEDELLGELYANLIDFNGDDIYELVIARYAENSSGEPDRRTDVNDLEFIGGFSNPSIHIFSIDANGNAVHVDEYPFVTYGEEGMRFSVEYTTVDGKPYFVFGGDVGYSAFEGDLVDNKVFMEFDGTAFSLADDFSTAYTYQNAGYEPTGYYHNQLEVSQEEFTAAYDVYAENLVSHVVVAEGFTPDYEQVTKNTLDFLATYQIKNTEGQGITYSDGYFLINEHTSHTPFSDIVVEYLQALTLGDREAMLRLANNDTIASLHYEERMNASRHPGMIIESTELVNSQFYAGESLSLMQDIVRGNYYSEPHTGDFVDTIIVKVDMQEVIDMEVAQYAGQYGSDVTYWFMFEIDETGENAEIIGIYNDYNHSEETDDPFHVAYLASYDTIFGSYGYEFPIDVFEMLLDENEISNIEYYGTDDPSEMYLIKNSWNTPMRVYENTAGADGAYVRGDLLYETSGNILYLGCTSSHFSDDGYPYTDIEIVTMPFDGYEVSYYPQLSHPNEWVHYGLMATELPFH